LQMSREKNRYLRKNVAAISRKGYGGAGRKETIPSV
jgi:hypothetical protein